MRTVAEPPNANEAPHARVRLDFDGVPVREFEAARSVGDVMGGFEFGGRDHVQSGLAPP